MNIIILGAAGFIGTNLVLELSKDESNVITLVDKDIKYFDHIKKFGINNLKFLECSFDENVDYTYILRNQEIVYHLYSTTTPTTSNMRIANEITSNVSVTANILECCVKMNIKRVVFISSGGTVYGIENKCPLSEEMTTNPISSYGIQKIAIEKLLYLYDYIYGLDYRIIRLSNPYGPYQRPNGKLGVVTTFIYKALREEDIILYGDGSVIRDFIFIDDAIQGIIKIAESNSENRIYNLGSGIGTSLKDLLLKIEKNLNKSINVCNLESRNVDVPVNFLNISKFENDFGQLHLISLDEGIKKTANFLKQYYQV